MQKLEEEFQTLQFENMYESQNTISMTMYCQRSGKALFNINEKGQKKYLAEHGRCKRCNYDFHIDEMVTHGMTKSAWPMRYNGYTCKGCYQ